MSKIQNSNITGNYNCCNLCFEPLYKDDKIHYMKVYGRSEKRKVHDTCFHRYLEVDNTGFFNSTKVRKNGVINKVKISVYSADVDNLKSYLISSKFTYIRANQHSITFMSYQFSGCSSISKTLKKLSEKFSDIEIKNVLLYNINSEEECNITMKNGNNTDYTEAIRLYNASKYNKLDKWLEEHN